MSNLANGTPAISADPTLLLHTQQLADEVRRRVDQLTALNTVTAVVSQSLDLNVTLQTAMDAVLSVIDVEAAGISLIDESAGELVLRAQKGWKQDFVTRPMRIKLGQGMSGQVIATGEVMVTGDPSTDPRLVVPAVADENIRAQAMAPMHARGKVIGVLSVISYQPYTFDEQEIAVLRAIADQVGVALDNARLYQSAREQQSRLLTVLQSTADAIIATDRDGLVNVINEAAGRLFNLDAEAVIGAALLDLPFTSELRDGLGRALAGDLRSFDVALPSGGFLSAVVSPVISPVHADAADLLPDSQTLDRAAHNGWVVVFQDITHIKEAERGRLQFIQTAAHDLRNPLGVTLSALTMLSKGWKNPTPTETEVFGIAMRGVGRMQDLIDDLLHLEKIESGLDLEMLPLDVADLIERSAMDIKPSLQVRDQVLEFEIAPGLPIVAADMRWLSRALANLLSNAHKYTPEGGHIVLRAFTADGELILEVQDDGPGIPADAQARLGERFYRVPQTQDKVTGTGLGLAIVRSIMEKHHGRVGLRSAPGQGSTFSLILPLDRAG